MRRNELTLANTVPQLIAGRTGDPQLAVEGARRVDAVLVGGAAAAAAGALVHICNTERKKKKVGKQTHSGPQLRSPACTSACKTTARVNVIVKKEVGGEKKKTTTTAESNK